MSSAFAAAAALAAQMDSSNHTDNWGGWMWLWGGFMMLAVIGVVVWLVVRSTGGSRPRGDRAREIVDERHAKGELTTEEYRERIDQLR